MSELALEDGPDFPAAAHEAAGGQVVYITEHGRRLAAIVPAELAEDIADAAAARAARASVEEGEALVPWEQVKAEAGLVTQWLTKSSSATKPERHSSR